MCRETWLRTDASQLVFDPVIVNLADCYTDYVIDGLNRMDKTCKSISVKHAHAKLAKAAESIQQDNAVRLFSNKSPEISLSPGTTARCSRELRPAHHPAV